MKNSIFKFFKILMSAFFLSSCVSDKDTAAAIVKERFADVLPESFLNINIKPRGKVYFVSFPAENRIGYVQFTLIGYVPEKPSELKFYAPIAKIQGEIDEVCRVNNLTLEKLLPLMHEKITSYYKIGVSQVKGINSKPYVAFQYNDEVVLCYVANLTKVELESFFDFNEFQVLNKNWLYEKYESDLLN